MRPLLQAIPSTRATRTTSSATGFGDGMPRLDAAADYLARQPAADQRTPAPVIPAIYRFGDTRLALISTLAQFGTPEDLLLHDLRVEFFFPADDPTAQALRALDPH